jgi:surface protein
MDGSVDCSSAYDATLEGSDCTGFEWAEYCSGEGQCGAAYTVGAPNSCPSAWCTDGDPSTTDVCTLTDTYGGVSCSDGCIADCNGDCDGMAMEDNCGVCDDDPSNDDTTCCVGDALLARIPYGIGVNTPRDVAMSSDGAHIVVPSWYGVQRSTDAGASWATIGFEVTGEDALNNPYLWGGIAGSSDGTYLIIASHQTTDYDYETDIETRVREPVLAISSDAGDTWTELDEPLPELGEVDGYESYGWGPLVSWSDGEFALLSDSVGNLWRSSNYGANWVELSASFDGGAYKMRASADGGLIVATVGDKPLISRDQGDTWESLDAVVGQTYWVDVSSDGGTLVAASGTDGKIRFSFDGGTVWEERTPVGYTPADFSQDGYWTGVSDVSLSADGQRVVIAAALEGLLVSEDAGLSWRYDTLERDVGFDVLQVIAWIGEVSDSGDVILAVDIYGTVYVSGAEQSGTPFNDCGTCGLCKADCYGDLGGEYYRNVCGQCSDSGGSAFGSIMQAGPYRLLAACMEESSDGSCPILEAELGCPVEAWDTSDTNEFTWMITHPDFEQSLDCWDISSWSLEDVSSYYGDFDSLTEVPLGRYGDAVNCEVVERDGAYAIDCIEHGSCIECTDGVGCTDWECDPGYTGEACSVCTGDEAFCFPPCLVATDDDIHSLVEECLAEDAAGDCADLYDGCAIGDWDVSAVTDMRSLFEDYADFDQPIGLWDTSSVTDMSSMFYGANSFDQPIGDWDVSAVTDVTYMFYDAYAFNEPIGDWELNSLTELSDMFSFAYAFDQDLSGWDTSNIEYMSGTFSYATSFNQDISSWDTSNVVGMGAMFVGASSFNQDLSAWDVSANQNIRHMFWNAAAFDQDLSCWDTSSVLHSDDLVFEGSASDCIVTGDTADGYDIDCVEHGRCIECTDSLGCTAWECDEGYTGEGCAETCGGTAVADECGVCGGDGSSCRVDCSDIVSYQQAIDDGCTHIDGVLFVDSTTATDLSALSHVVSYDMLHVTNNVQLTSLSGLAPQASLIGANVSFNPMLTDLVALNLLESTVDRDACVARFPYDSTPYELTDDCGSLIVHENNTLTTLDDLSAFREADWNVSVQDHALTSMAGLNGLELVGHDVFLQGGDGAAFEISGFSSLTSVGRNLYIQGNGSLTAVSGFDALEDLVALYIQGNSGMLTSVGGFAALTDVEENIYIQGNNALTTLSGFVGLTDLNGSLSISNNILDSVTAFASLTDVHGDLKVRTNRSLSELSWLNNLSHVRGDVTIRSNPDLCPEIIADFVAAVLVDGTLSTPDNGNCTLCLDGVVPLTECVDDCNFVLGGSAETDSCGVCAGGTTGRVPDSDLDCAGECHGSAVDDVCGVCDGPGLPSIANGSCNACDATGCTDTACDDGFESNDDGTACETSLLYTDCSAVDSAELQAMVSDCLAEDATGDCPGVCGSAIGTWDVSSVINMNSLFSGALAFDADIGDWNVANVTTMQAMFKDAASFNQDISRWDMSQVVDMKRMFRDAVSFDQDIRTWDTVRATNMQGMFDGATAFSFDLDCWDTGVLVNADNMFEGALLSTCEVQGTPGSYSIVCVVNGRCDACSADAECILWVCDSGFAGDACNASCAVANATTYSSGCTVSACADGYAPTSDGSACEAADACGTASSSTGATATYPSHGDYRSVASDVVVNCNGEDACKDHTIRCPTGDYSCDVICDGKAACSGDTKIYAGGGPFDLTCRDEDSCKGNTKVYCGVDACQVDCDPSEDTSGVDMKVNQQSESCLYTNVGNRCDD